MKNSLLRARFGLTRWFGRGFKSCPDCDEQIPTKAKYCRFCGWEGGYRAHVRPTLRHSLLSIVNSDRKRAGKTMPCPHCEWEMPAKAKRCPLCQCAPTFVDPETMPLNRAWRHLRRQWIVRRTKHEVVCDSCSLKVPAWSSTCLGCGWECPQEIGRLATLGRAFTKMRCDRRGRTRARRVPACEMCPDCEVPIPNTDRECLVCGWIPEHKTTLKEAVGHLVTAGKRRIAPAKPKFKLCECCEVVMPPHARMCLACGWAPPIANPLVRALRQKKVRKVRISDDASRPCPNCRLSLPNHVAKCMACGWQKRSTGYYGKTPRATWATMAVLCVGLYFAIHCFVVLAAGGHGMSADQDQYGRNRFDTTVLTSAAPMTP